MARVFSGIKPTGEVHLGNYIGALRQWVAAQDENEAIYCVVDLHALTVEIDPAELHANTLAAATNLLAVGLDPERCLLFCQSHRPEHAELSWILECVTSYGELRRMTQFKEKGGQQAHVTSGLFTYPVLMAADILLYGADEVPVGDDQRQHLELARTIAERFNTRYRSTFVVPNAAIPTAGGRVMDLQHPENKMSKSENSPLGTILLSDPPDEIRKKIRRAVTDTESEVRHDPVNKPGVTNLLELLGAATGGKPKELASGFSNYGELKAAVAEALVDLLTPIQERYRELATDPRFIEKTLANGAERAGAIAAPMLDRVRAAIGLLERG